MGRKSSMFRFRDDHTNLNKSTWKLIFYQDLKHSQAPGDFLHNLYLSPLYHLRQFFCLKREVKWCGYWIKDDKWIDAYFYEEILQKVAEIILCFLQQHLGQILVRWLRWNVQLYWTWDKVKSEYPTGLQPMTSYRVLGFSNCWVTERLLGR